jgi:hypothetical protein
MIANSVELRVAVRNLRIMERALESLRTQLEASNPWLFGVTSKAYIRRIELLQGEIADYLAEHPSEVSLIVPQLEQAEAAVAHSLDAPSLELKT